MTTPTERLAPPHECGDDNLSDWLSDIQIKPAEPLAEVDRYIGFWNSTHQTMRT
ncbi:hypothetical protein N183_36635 [Sinorhizobium sp. Sb3]|nr:hypothetical protein N183_36635 [Sinorhizobium sp. Sb3]